MTTIPLDTTIWCEASTTTRSPALQRGRRWGTSTSASRTSRRPSTFYRGLGFDAMARRGDEAAFLAREGYHHHVGANTWQSRVRPMRRTIALGSPARRSWEPPKSGRSSICSGSRSLVPTDCEATRLPRDGSRRPRSRHPSRPSGRLPVLRAGEAGRVAGARPPVGRDPADPRVLGLAAEARAPARPVALRDHPAAPGRRAAVERQPSCSRSRPTTRRSSITRRWCRTSRATPRRAEADRSVRRDGGA